MDWSWYLFGFKGRINRAKYWLAGLVILSFMIVFVALAQLSLMINFVAHAMGTAHGKGEVSFGFDLDDIFAVLDPAAWRALSFAKLPMLLVKATRYLPPAEIALLTLLETLLGPLWTWLGVGEQPGTPTLIGGAIVLVAIAANESIALFGPAKLRRQISDLGTERGHGEGTLA